MNEKEITSLGDQITNAKGSITEPNLNEDPTKMYRKDGIRIPGWWLTIIALYLWLMVSMMLENKELTAWRISKGERIFSTNFGQFIHNWRLGLLRGIEGSFYYSAGVLAIPGTLFIVCMLLYLPVKDYAAFRGVFVGTIALMIIHPLLEFLIHPL